MFGVMYVGAAYTLIRAPDYHPYVATTLYCTYVRTAREAAPRPR